jgi:hypothetical protein
LGDAIEGGIGHLRETDVAGERLAESAAKSGDCAVPMSSRTIERTKRMRITSEAS